MAIPHPRDVKTVAPPIPPALELVDVHDIVRRHPAFTESSLRALIHRAEQNGLHLHLYRIGRRVLIDARGFEDWVRSKQNAFTRARR